MGHFQPDALTLSRGELWADRRRFTEAVVDTGRPAHRLGDRFVAVCREEVAALLDEVERDDGGVLGYEAMHRAFRRIVRRVVLGDARARGRGAQRLLGDADVRGQRAARRSARRATSRSSSRVDAATSPAPSRAASRA